MRRSFPQFDESVSCAVCTRPLRVMTSCTSVPLPPTTISKAFAAIHLPRSIVATSSTDINRFISRLVLLLMLTRVLVHQQIQRQLWDFSEVDSMAPHLTAIAVLWQFVLEDESGGNVAAFTKSFCFSPDNSSEYAVSNSVQIAEDAGQNTTHLHSKCNVALSIASKHSKPLLWPFRIISLIGYLPFVSAGEGGDDFTNNLFSDLAPLLSLFGEQVAKQYMSHSLTWLESVIFAIGPLGIITAITGAIRVSGPSWLKALIGRAREGKGAVEVELMSSTSHDVSELWNGNGVSRLLGKAEPSPVVEIIYFEPVNESHDPEYDSTKELIYDFETATDPRNNVLKRKEKSSDDDSKPLLRSNDEAGLSRDSVASTPPNIGINLARKRLSQLELYSIAAIGVLLQSGVLAFAIMGVLQPLKNNTEFQKDDGPVQSHAIYVFCIGTVMLVTGMFVCGHIIERRSQEETWIPADCSPESSQWKGYRMKMIWLQKGETVNDQQFESYYISYRSPLGTHGANSGWQILRNKLLCSVFKSRRAAIRIVKSSNPKKPGPRLKLATTVFTMCSLMGYILQFIGLRGLSWTVTIGQLGVTGVMTVFRAYLRRGLVLHDVENQELPKDFEIPIAARRIKRCSYWSVVAPTPSRTPHLAPRSSVGLAASVVTATCRLQELCKWSGPFRAYSESLCGAIEFTMNYFSGSELIELLQEADGATYSWHLMLESLEEGGTETSLERIEIRLVREDSLDGRGWGKWKLAQNQRTLIEAILRQWMLQIDHNGVPQETVGDDENLSPRILREQDTDRRPKYRFYEFDFSNSSFSWIPNCTTTPTELDKMSAFGLPLDASRLLFPQPQNIHYHSVEGQSPERICCQLILSEFVSCLGRSIAPYTKIGGGYSFSFPRPDANSNVSRTESDTLLRPAVQNRFFNGLATSLEEMSIGSYPDILLCLIPPLSNRLPVHLPNDIRAASGIWEAITEAANTVKRVGEAALVLENVDKLFMWCIHTANLSARLYVDQKMLQKEWRGRKGWKDSKAEDKRKWEAEAQVQIRTEALGVYCLLISAFDYFALFIGHSSKEIGFRPGYVEDANSAMALFCEEFYLKACMEPALFSSLSSDERLSFSLAVYKKALREAFEKDHVEEIRFETGGRGLNEDMIKVLTLVAQARFSLETSAPASVLGAFHIIRIDSCSWTIGKRGENLHRSICRHKRPHDDDSDSSSCIRKVLFAAIESGSDLILLLLLRRYVEPAYEDPFTTNFNRTVIHHAILSSASVSKLWILLSVVCLKFPLMINIRNSSGRGQTALEMAVERNNGAYVRLLLFYGARENEAPIKPLHGKESASMLLRSSSAFTASEILGAQNMVLFAESIRPSTVPSRTVKQIRETRERTYQNGTWTSLQWILWRGELLGVLEDLEEMIDEQADKWIVRQMVQRDERGKSALQYAAQNGRFQTLNFLLFPDATLLRSLHQEEVLPSGLRHLELVSFCDDREHWFEVLKDTILHGHRQLARRLLFEYKHLPKTTMLAIAKKLIVTASLDGVHPVIEFFLSVLQDDGYKAKHLSGYDKNLSVYLDCQTSLGIELEDTQIDCIYNAMDAPSGTVGNDLAATEDPAFGSMEYARSGTTVELTQMPIYISSRRPLSLAAEADRLSVVRTFINGNCFLGRIDRESGRDALADSVFFGRERIALVLLQAGAHATYFDEATNQTLLTLAIAKGFRVETITLLLKAAALNEDHDPGLRNALAAALRSEHWGRADVIALLRDAGAEVVAHDHLEERELHHRQHAPSPVPLRSTTIDTHDIENKQGEFTEFNPHEHVRRRYAGFDPYASPSPVISEPMRPYLTSISGPQHSPLVVSLRSTTIGTHDIEYQRGEFTGFNPHEHFRRRYAGSDPYASPSRVISEPMPYIPPIFERADSFECDTGEVWDFGEDEDCSIRSGSEGSGRESRKQSIYSVA
ncbi:ankyrin [Ascobolus immersus RN42]|uniref:Ankyrin n=1 Tax=Ascobolus immersus RN42 TaxID=1160509 RepID=A0A3N4ICX4_ASCIM|nr:ankyrin [Ascobolus immersus RN42]